MSDQRRAQTASLLHEEVANKTPLSFNILALLFLLTGLGLTMSLIPCACSKCWQQLGLQKLAIPTTLTQLRFVQQAPSFQGQHSVWKASALSVGLVLRKGLFSLVKLSALRSESVACNVNRMHHFPSDSRSKVRFTMQCAAFKKGSDEALSDFILTSSDVPHRPQVRIPRLIYKVSMTDPDVDTKVITAGSSGMRGIEIDSSWTGTDADGPALKPGTSLRSLLSFGPSIARDDFFVQVKLNPDWAIADRLMKEHQSMMSLVMVAIDKILSNLELAYLDSVLLTVPHWNNCRLVHERTMEAWRAMERLVRIGLVRQLGIANVTSGQQLRAIYTDATFKPVIVQQLVNIETVRRTFLEREMRLWCAEAQICFQVSGNPIADNKLLIESEAMTDLAKKYAVTPQTLVFRYLMQLGILIVVSSGSTELDAEIFSAHQIPLKAPDGNIISGLMFFPQK